MHKDTISFGIRLTPIEHEDLSLLADFFSVPKSKILRRLIKQTADAIKVDIQNLKEQ